MAFDRIDPSDQIPEADLLDQQTPLNPPPLTDLDDIQRALKAPIAPIEPIDEADRWEQELPVPSAEDDYPDELDRAGWS